MVIKDLGEELERVLAKVRESKESDRWEESERILEDALVLVREDPRVHLCFVNADYEEDLAL